MDAGESSSSTAQAPSGPSAVSRSRSRSASTSPPSVQASGSGARSQAHSHSHSLFAYFGGKPPGRRVGGDDAASTSSASAASAAAPARKRRKKVDASAGEGQARLMRAEGGAWALGKVTAPAVSTPLVQDGARAGEMDNEGGETAGEADVDVDVGGGGAVAPAAKKRRSGTRPRKGGTGEEAEMLEMQRRGKAARGGVVREVKGKKAANGVASRGSASRSPEKASPVPLSQNSRRTTPTSPPAIHLVSSDPVEGDEAEPTLVASRRPTRRGRRKLHEESEDDDGEVTITGVRLDKPAIPSHLTSRSASVSSRGVSQTDPIDVDSDAGAAHGKKMPRKLVFAADQGKPAHSFFGLGRAGAGAGAGVGMGSNLESAAAVAQAGETIKGDAQVQVQAQAIPGLPMSKKGSSQGRTKNGVVPATHSFFSLGGQAEPGKLKKGWGGGVKDGEEWLAPWPGARWPGHLDVVECAEAGPSRIKRRSLVRPANDDLSFGWFPRDAGQGTTGLHESGPHGSDLHHQIDHPAIRSVSRRHRQANRETWCQKYRPLTAEQVLGNETESIYLRDWLRALSVGQESGPSRRVMRRVPRRKTELIEGWIVDDIEGFPDEDEDGAEEQEELDELDTLTLGFDSRPAAYPGFDARLANTMLLVGPHGCGKSAAVYAAAEEMGWEVFEVYPGIGRRTGAALMNLVGDVGRNHMVAQQQPATGLGKIPEKTGVAAFFGAANDPAKGMINGKKVEKDKAKGKNGVTSVKGMGLEEVVMPSSQGSERDPIDFLSTPTPSLDSEPSSGVDLYRGDAPKMAGAQPADAKGFKQSVILLDEVDLLYDEESTFWPAVVQLIAESRRPVVLTCNDIERVPIALLPLQSILHYRPAPAAVAVPYLAAIAAHEGIPVGRAQRLYDESCSTLVDLLERPLPPNGHEALPTFDLRRAITQMQLERAGGAAHSPHTPVYVNGEGASDGGQADGNGVPARGPDEELSAMCGAVDARSFADAFVAPRAGSMLDVCEVDRFAPTSDDVLGFHLLRKPTRTQRTVLASSEYSFEMASTVSRLGARHTRPLPELGNMQEVMTTHIRSLLPLLDPLIPLSAPLLPHPCLFAQYLPVLRRIVLADDVLQVEDEAALVRGEERRDRRTGRPKRITTLAAYWGAPAGGGGVRKEEYKRYFEDVGREGEDVVRALKWDGWGA